MAAWLRSTGVGTGDRSPRSCRSIIRSSSGTMGKPKCIVPRREIPNRDALANPDALDAITRVPGLWD